MSKSKLIVIYGNTSKTINNKIYVSEKDFLIPYGKNYDLAVDELNRIQKSIINNNSFLSLFSYQNVSIWWMIYPSLMPVINKIINFIHKFQILLNKEKPSKIIVENFAYFDLIEQICKSQKIKLVYSRSSLLSYLLTKKTKIYLQKYRFQKITNSKINFRKKLFLKQKRSIPSLTDKIVFITPSSSWKHISNSNVKHGEDKWYNLINLLKQTKDVVCIDLDYNFHGNNDVLKEKMNDENFWFPMESILESRFFKLNEHKSFFKNYNKLINQNQFQNLFNFKGISLWFQLKDFFNMMTFSPYIPLFLKLLDSTQAFFAKNQPNSVFLTYENGSLAQCFVASLIKLNVKSIGLQHGIIYKNSSNYVFDNFYTTDNPLGFPLPDFLLLFGDYAKQVLKQSNYPIERLITFGNSFFFNLENIKRKFDNEKLFLKHGINKNQKIILFTTGRMQRKYQATQGNYDYDEKIWEYLLENFGGNDDYFLFLKPHPTEYDVKIYEEILKKSTFSNAKVIQDDLFELISISSIIVSVFSTTMIDALCFNKNSIQVIFDNIKWPILKDKSDVISVSELYDLSKTIVDILEDKNLRNLLSKNRINFIKNHYNLPETDPLGVLSDIISK